MIVKKYVYYGLLFCCFVFSDCNGSGGVLATPVSNKNGFTLSHPQPEASLWIEPNAPSLRPSPTPDYAEVTQQRSLTSFQPPESAAAYATTTLVPAPSLQGSIYSRDRGVSKQFFVIVFIHLRFKIKMF